MTALKMGMTPPHPGIFLYDEVVKPLSLTIEQAAEALGVRQDTLSALLQGQESLAPEMALRFEKVFSVNMEMMLKLQAAYDAAQMRKQAEKTRFKQPLATSGIQIDSWLSDFKAILKQLLDRTGRLESAL